MYFVTSCLFQTLKSLLPSRVDRAVNVAYAANNSVVSYQVTFLSNEKPVDTDFWSYTLRKIIAGFGLTGCPFLGAGSSLIFCELCLVHIWISGVYESNGTSSIFFVIDLVRSSHGVFNGAINFSEIWQWVSRSLRSRVQCISISLYRCSIVSHTRPELPNIWRLKICVVKFIIGGGRYANYSRRIRLVPFEFCLPIRVSNNAQKPADHNRTKFEGILTVKHSAGCRCRTQQLELAKSFVIRSFCLWIERMVTFVSERCNVYVVQLVFDTVIYQSNELVNFWNILSNRYFLGRLWSESRRRLAFI